MWESIVEIDQNLFRWVNNLWIGKFSDFWLFVTQIENWLPLYILFFYLLFKNFQKPLNLFAMGMIPIIALSALTLTNSVKDYVERLRPNNEPMLMDSIVILQRPENFSFWSGHSAVSFAVTTFIVLALHFKGVSKWIWLFYLWPVTFAFSRLFVGVHYPVDVTVGMLVGIFLGWIFYVMFTRWIARLE